MVSGARPHTPASDWREHITSDPAVLVGKPPVRGTRLSVELILELLASGWSMDDVLANYPTLPRDSVPAVFACAAEAVRALPRDGTISMSR
jgi:uncharacterized protein (DUF433 family)